MFGKQGTMKRLKNNILIGLIMTSLVIGVALLLLWSVPGSFTPGYQPTILVQFYLFCGIVTSTFGLSYFCATMVKPKTKWVAFTDGMIWLVVYVILGLAVGVFNNDLSMAYGALSSWFVMIALFCGSWFYAKWHGL